MKKKKKKKKIEKIFIYLEIIELELVALNTRYYEKEYLSSCVSMLINNLKILDTTKKEFFELIFIPSDQKI